MAAVEENVEQKTQAEVLDEHTAAPKTKAKTKAKGKAHARTT
jgi:hypothetical protein